MVAFLVAADDGRQAGRVRGVHVAQRLARVVHLGAGEPLRAVQDLSSVGGNAGGLGNSLQAQALKLFDDFGYRQIGISCRLAEKVCEMDGLSSAANRFIIVQGSGLPRLGVVGFNRRVDWPTLVQRLVDVTQGDSKPVFE